MAKVLVWDWPTRIGHWLLAGSFVLCWLTSESESWRLVHVIAGAVVLAIATFRLLWGVIGTRYARFSDFVCGPSTVARYLNSLLKLQPIHYTGHNPAGGWAIIALLGLAIASSASGWLIYNDLGGHLLEELHEGLAASMLAVVIVHLAGVFSGSLLHGENLVRAMLTGNKSGDSADAIASAKPLAALMLLIWIFALSWLIVSG
jgi:cytochrome b